MYLDDIIIYSNFFEEYIEYLALILETLERYKLYAKPSKYTIGVKELEFYSYIISGERYRPTSTKV